MVQTFQTQKVTGLYKNFFYKIPACVPFSYCCFSIVSFSLCTEDPPQPYSASLPASASVMCSFFTLSARSGHMSCLSHQGPHTPLARSFHACCTFYPKVFTKLFARLESVSSFVRWASCGQGLCFIPPNPTSARHRASHMFQTKKGRNQANCSLGFFYLLVLSSWASAWTSI